MKNPLLSQSLAAAIALTLLIPCANGQNPVFSEDFSGFTTGSHETPSTSDISNTLDSKTSVPGWTGYKVYSAGGEIKISTADVPGWIETPEIDLSGYGGIFLLKFDIARWPGDATIVKILFNGTQAADAVNPQDEFASMEMVIPEGIPSVKIRFESIAKRFYLDNVQIISQYPTGDVFTGSGILAFSVYPNPASEFILVRNLSREGILEAIDLSGRLLYKKEIDEQSITIVPISGWPSGIYILRINYQGKIFFRTIIKEQGR